MTPAFAASRNTSWGGSSSTSWGGSSNTSWGGSSSTSWGGSSNTSWGGGRGRAAMTALAIVLPLIAALPVIGRAVHTDRVVVVGAHAASAAHSVGAGHVALLANGVAVADATPAQAATLKASGLRVAADSPVKLDAAAVPQVSSTNRLDVRELLAGNYVPSSYTQYSGYGETIAVVDSGVNAVPGLAGRVIQGADFTGTGFNDGYGHGTFVASLAAGSGRAADGSYTGIQGAAPAARIVSVKVADGAGRSTVGQVVAGLAWVINHQAQYGINVVNLSFSEAHASSYLTDPVDALVEAAYFSGMTVVASAGNDGGNVTSAPGNDPYVITVGSVNDANTFNMSDDTASPFSNAGTTADGVSKPDITTFGAHVQAALPVDSVLAGMQTVTGLPTGYGQMSGTSMSTGVASGFVAVLQTLHPSWTAGQIKGAMVSTRTSSLRELRPINAATLSSVSDANAGLKPSLALAVAYAQQILHTTSYGNVVWSNVVWSDATWSNVVWSDVVWSDVATVVQTAATWSDATWSNATWSDATWSDAVWSDATWSDAVWSNGLAGGS